MSNSQQQADPTRSASEREQLAVFLDKQRAAIFRKVEGVSDEDLRRQMTPSGLSLLGLVKHLAYVEMGWFQMDFLGEDIPEDDPDADFRIESGETTADILAFYQQQIERARQIVAEHSLDEIARNSRRQPSLRWIVLHMIEETARHAGHADLMREAIDGSTGM